MITLKDWLTLMRSGVDLFNLTGENVADAMTRLNYASFGHFAADLRIFFAGWSNDTPAGENVENGPNRAIKPHDVFAVIAIVDDWQSLTWYEAATIANAKIENDVANRAVLLCAINNAHAVRKSDIKHPADFNPIEKARKAAEIKRLKAEAGITPEVDTRRLLDVLGGVK